jgi:carboxypeptidase Taq
MNYTELYAQYVTRMQKIADVRYAIAVLQWDQETYMPKTGTAHRAGQLATLSEMSHGMFTDPSFKALLESLQACDGPDDEQKRNVELTWYDYTQQHKLSTAFVRQLSEATSRSFQAWVTAKTNSDFSVFRPHLQHLIGLKREEADLLGFSAHPYDALLNQYERGSTVAQLDQVFSRLRDPLKTLLTEIARKPQPETGFLHRHYEKNSQWQFGMDILRQMGFDFDAGRQDIAEHPFTTNFSSQDVRLTTRIDENDFGNMTWSCIHEGGHGLYEQGLPDGAYGLPLGEFTSLGIHESQSRLWENNVGRSLDAWQYLYPLAQHRFPEVLGDISLQQFYRAINTVRPSLIRTEADELTYHFHVQVRYELEKKVIDGSLNVADIPEWWNQSYHRLLDIEVPDDRHGCLQDVHWSHGSFGYFPTYSLGSLYAAQFFASARKEVPALDAGITKGEYKPLLNWLRTSIHRHGRRYTSQELCERISGEALNIDYFIDYATAKYQAIYGW